MHTQHTRHTRAPAAALVLALILVLAACGHSATSNTASGRVIEMDMTDNAFAPTQVQATKGETITFRFRNKGTVVHEAVIGGDAVQAMHHEEMTAGTAMGQTSMSMPPTTAGGGGHGHAGAETSGGNEAVSVPPGQAKDLKHTFAEPGTVLIGCHEPGHWEAGMKATVTVT